MIKCLKVNCFEDDGFKNQQLRFFLYRLGNTTRLIRGSGIRALLKGNALSIIISMMFFLGVKRC